MEIPDTASRSAAYTPVFIARQPVFDREDGVFGYELLFRHSGTADAAKLDDAESATARVVVDGIAMARPCCGTDTRLFINFPASLLLSGAASVLPAESCVVELLETVPPSEEVVAACRELKNAGHMLALDDYVGQEGYGPLLDLADIVKVDLLGRGSPEIIGLTQDLQTRGCTLLAEKVEDEFSYALARALGYQLFQGYHFARPMNVEGRTLSPNRAAKLLLLKELADPDYSVKRVARTIATDLSLSYRLIRYLNSASLSVRERVSSVEQAVSMLGGGPLRQWLSIVMITEMNASQRASALLLSGVQRARFLECLCGDLAAPPSPPETMFLLGLFSNLDAILNMPMQEITSDLPLEQDMLDALNGRPTRPRQWIDLALHLERGEWGEAGKVLARHKLDPKRAALHHSKAGAWAGRLLECAREDHAAGVPNSRREAQ